MHRPPTLATVAEATPPRTGVLRARLLRPAGRHAMVVAHFFDPASDASTLGPSRERTANAGAVALASTGYIAAIDEKAWAGPRRLGPASRVPHSVSRHCHGDSSRAEYARRKVESSFWSGAGSQPSCGAGTGCSPANGTPEELRRLARPCVLSIALRSGSTMITETSAKNLWGAYASNVIRTY